MLQLTPQITAGPVFTTDKVHSGKVMRTLLWLSVIGFLVRITLFMRMRDTSEFASVDVLAFVQICIIMFLCVLLPMSSRLGTVLRSLWPSSGGMLLAYYLLCAASAAWSPIPAYSFYRAVEVIVLMLAIFMALSYSRDFDSAELTILLICLLTFILGVTGWAKLRNWNLWGDNGTSASAAMIVCYCVGQFDSSSKRRQVILFAVGGIALVYLLLVGRSMASLTGMACGIILVAFISPRRKYLILSVLAGAICIWIGGQHFVSEVFLRGKTMEQVQSLHGRLPMWKELVDETPLLYGQGFAVAARLIGISSTHNGLIAVFTGTGALGLIIVTLGLVRLSKELWGSVRAHRPGAVGCAAALIAGLINCLSHPVIGEYWRPESTVFTCFLALHLFYTKQPPVSTWPQSHYTTCNQSDRLGYAFRSTVVTPGIARSFEL